MASGAGWFVKPTDDEITDRVAFGTWWVDTTTGTIKLWDGSQWLIKTPPGTASLVYVMGGFKAGKPASGSLFFEHVPTMDITIPAGGTNSTGRGAAAATATTTFSLRKNGVEFGTMQWAAAGQFASFTVGSDTSFVRASLDYFSIVTPNPRDTTLADISFGILALKG